VSGTQRQALITGLTGQDGSFLAELLLERGYAVTGVVRMAAGQDRPSVEQPPGRAGQSPGPVEQPPVPTGPPLGLSEHLRGRVELVHGELLVPDTLRAAVRDVRPDEIYHLAAPSFVPASWEHPARTLNAIAGATAALLEATRELDAQRQRRTRVFVATSGSMFGAAPESPQRETTPFRPATPYALAKLAAHQLVGALRAHDGLHVSSGILYNHESERRPAQFVTRKISRGAAAISLGLEQELTLGDLSAVRDWSYAADVMRGAWLMLQREQPDDYILASGTPHTVAQFAQAAFACVGLDADSYVRVDQALVRAPETVPSVGDPSKARAQLSWEPRVGFQEMVERMVQADLHALQAQAGERSADAAGERPVGGVAERSTGQLGEPGVTG
jgi:GDPmannose 4,6-dehydratase